LLEACAGMFFWSDFDQNGTEHGAWIRRVLSSFRGHFKFTMAGLGNNDMQQWCSKLLCVLFVPQNSAQKGQKGRKVIYYTIAAYHCYPTLPW
jgi:uncharacterized protein YlxP (DUF503 family)